VVTDADLDDSLMTAFGPQVEVVHLCPHRPA